MIPLALFIVVGMGVLALTISRTVSSGKSAAVLEALSVQTFYAAESGAQYAMNQLFFNVEDRAVVDGNCAAISGTTMGFTAPGLNGCNVRLSCAISTDPADTTSFYSIQSAASCGVAALSSQRTIAVSAMMQ